MSSEQPSTLLGTLHFHLLIARIVRKVATAPLITAAIITLKPGVLCNDNGVTASASVLNLVINDAVGDDLFSSTDGKRTLDGVADEDNVASPDFVEKSSFSTFFIVLSTVS